MTPDKPSPAGTDDTKARMVERALEMLARGEEVTLREVGARVGSRTTPYHYFGKSRDGGGHDALLAAVAARGFRLLRDAMTRAVKGAGADRLRRLARAYVKFALANRSLFDLMFSPRLVGKLHLEGLGMARWEGQVVIQGTILECQRDGLVPAAWDTTRLTEHVWATIHGTARLLMDGQLQLMDPDLAPDAFAEEAVEIFLHGLSGRAAQTGP